MSLVLSPGQASTTSRMSLDPPEVPEPVHQSEPVAAQTDVSLTEYLLNFGLLTLPSYTMSLLPSLPPGVC